MAKNHTPEFKRRASEFITKNWKIQSDECMAKHLKVSKRCIIIMRRKLKLNRIVLKQPAKETKSKNQKQTNDTRSTHRFNYLDYATKVAALCKGDQKVIGYFHGRSARNNNEFRMKE